MGDFVLSETEGEDLGVYAKMQLDPLVFNDTGLTVRRQYEPIANGRVTFADRIRARQGQERQRPWYLREGRTPTTPLDLGDWMQYATTSQPDFLRYATPPLSMEEFERQLNEAAATAQREFMGVAPRRKKTSPKKDWGERITPEDTKELDEFLNSLARKGTLESAT